MSTATLPKANGRKPSSRKPDTESGIWRVEFWIQGNTGLTWGRKAPEERRDDESHDAFDERTVLSRVRLDKNRNLAISAEGIKRAILVGGTRLQMKVPGGGGKQTFKARLQAGLLMIEDSFTVFKADGKPATLDDIVVETIYVPSDPSKPKGGRVNRRFPKLYGSWSARCQYLLTDEAISEDVLLRHIKAAGVFDGIGTFRVGVGQTHGLFALLKDEEGEPMLTIEPFVL